MTLAVVGSTGVRWLDWLVVISVFLTVSGVIWTKAVRPLVRFARVFDQVLPPLIEIGHQFQRNGGDSLKDSLDRIEVQLRTNSEQVQATNTKVSDLAVKHEELHTYAHDTRHEQRGQITKLTLADEVLTAKLDTLTETVAESVTGVQRIEAAQTVVAGDLAAAVGRADAASRSADESE